MNKNACIGMLAGILLTALMPETVSAEIEKDFKNPPPSAKPHTWWHWMDGNVSKEGITKDLESFKKVGIGGFQLFDISWAIPHGGVAYHSEAYHECVAYAVAEAERLGLEMAMNGSSGWSSTGGPWVTPEQSMKMLIWSEQEIEPGDGNILLAKPAFNEKQAPYEYYRDVAVLAFPAPADAEYRIDEWEAKSLTDILSRSDRLAPSFKAAPSNAVIAPEDIHVLSDKMDANGLLNWHPQSGRWTVVRFGYTTTGSCPRPTSKGGKGLEIDKLSRNAAELHWRELLSRFLEDAGQKEALTTFLIDSYEVGHQNWTDGFETHFMEMRGYDLIPNLLCLTGRVIKNTDYTERVLWDLRQAVADLMYRNYFLFFREKCHAHGLKLACEPYGTGSFDAPRIARMVDLPMTEFWHRDEPWPRRNLWEWTAQIVPSAARLSGKRLVGAESFTRMQGDWTAHPYRMKVWGDRAFCHGVNRYYFSSSAHQPFRDDVKPGMTMGMFGIQNHRNNTWFFESAAWIDYITRCQFIFQSGDYVSDLLVLYGDERGFNNLPGEKEQPDVPWLPGHRFDLGSIDILDALSVDDRGCLHITHENERLPNPYKMLLLKRSVTMTVETARKLGELAKQGAVILAEKPVRTPGLDRCAENDRELRKLAKTYWDAGWIHDPKELDEVLAKIGPDCEMPGRMEYCHHVLPEGEFYFLSNQSYDTRNVNASFRTGGRLPELWNPETGNIQPAPNWHQEDGRTEVNLDMDPAGALFVVFRKPTSAKGNSSTKPEVEETARIEGSWTVAFDPAYGPEEEQVFQKLVPWNKHRNEEIKYFSGTASYRNTFNLKKTTGPVYLDLGEVEVMARVLVNGQDLGVLWKPPFRVNISEAVHKGGNDVEIRVTNLWPNRLIGDAPLPDFGERPLTPEGKPNVIYTKLPEWLENGEPIPEGARRTFLVWHHWKEGDELLPSGLLGPVRILKVK